MAEIIVSISDFVCGMPLFLLLIGGGLFFLFYSGFAPFRFYGKAIASLKDNGEKVEGQISSFEALTSAIAATVGMGNIAGVAIALTMGGPGAIFWMWVSAVVGMSTKFFEGTLAVMFKGKDDLGHIQGGPMYMITEGIGKKWKPMAVFFSIFGMIGTFCIMQANQLTEAFTTVFTTPAGIENTIELRFIIGLIIAAIVAVVVLGGIERIAKISSKIVPFMVGSYFLLVFYIIITNITKVPGVFYDIVTQAFNFEAGFGAIVGIAIIGARRAALVNEAGVGTASMMHGASKNPVPVKEGFVAMIGPSIDSGFVCTLTAIAILLTGNYQVAGEGVKGLEIAIGAFEAGIPGWGGYLLMFMVLIFAFSTMFSYSYYGVKCASYLVGAKYGKYYNYIYLVMIVVAAMIPLKAAVGLIDLAYALMAIPTMLTLFILAPKAKAALNEFLAKEKAAKGN
jgi:AGCS family alanine or glycine:cation symporter